MKTVGVTRLHKLGTPKVLRQTDGHTDEWSGPTTRPALAKTMQEKKSYRVNNPINYSVCIIGSSMLISLNDMVLLGG